MEYIRFGNTGMKVSRICLGCMSYGGPNERWPWALDEETSRPFIKRALELGINFFDTANVYSNGRSEEILGKALRDLADPDRYLETFLVPSWAEHMRQHARVTVEDQATEARAFSFQQPGVEPFASHLIAARPRGGDHRTPTEPPYTALS